MGDQARGFQDIGESNRGLVIPFVIGAVLEAPIKGCIDFNNIELLAVVFKPSALGPLFRVETTFPVVIAPARCADQKAGCVWNRQGLWPRG